MPGTIDVTFAGAEVNAAVTMAALGGDAEFITALPDNEITDACLAELRGTGVRVDRVRRRQVGRFGLYFVEAGANQRAGNVIYDREGTTFSMTAAAEYAWPEVLSEAGWFHTTGIAASVSNDAADATIAAVRAAHAAGIPVSCDLNYRRKLWRWDAALRPEELARRTLEPILSLVDVVMGNGSDLAIATGSAWTASEPGGREGEIERCTRVAQEFVRCFRQVKWVAVTLREGCSATHNRWGAMLYRAEDAAVFLAPLSAGDYAPYEIPNIVDRLGSGDAFAGGLLFALQTPELAEPGTALRFAVAASCLAHSIKGDFNFCTRAEVEALMAGSNGGGLSR